MKAIVVARPGGPEVLELREVSDPAPAERQVLIEIEAAGLNRADLLQRRGLYPAPPGASEILGLECAGVVRALGPFTSGAKVGDRVMALLPGGGYAERVAIHEQLTLPIPEALNFCQAAAIPEAFLTAQEALFTLGRTEPGDWVLVHAAAGGVGSAALQLAVKSGARVIATAGGAAKGEFVKALGAENVVDYEREDFAAVVLEVTEGHGADVILDFVGGAYAEPHARCLAEGGRQVVIGLLGGAKASIDLSRLLMKRQSLLGLVMRTRSLTDKIAIVERFRRRYLGWFDDGRLCPLLDRVYPLANARAGHERMEANENLGKIVLQVT